jgi:hypothetical protein
MYLHAAPGYFYLEEALKNNINFTTGNPRPKCPNPKCNGIKEGKYYKHVDGCNAFHQLCYFHGASEGASKCTEGSNCTYCHHVDEQRTKEVYDNSIAAAAAAKNQYKTVPVNPKPVIKQDISKSLINTTPSYAGVVTDNNKQTPIEKEKEHIKIVIKELNTQKQKVEKTDFTDLIEKAKAEAQKIIDDAKKKADLIIEGAQMKIVECKKKQSQSIQNINDQIATFELLLNTLEKADASIVAKVDESNANAKADASNANAKADASNANAKADASNANAKADASNAKADESNANATADASNAKADESNANATADASNAKADESNANATADASNAKADASNAKADESNANATADAKAKTRSWADEDEEYVQKSEHVQSYAQKTATPIHVATVQENKNDELIPTTPKTPVNKHSTAPKYDGGKLKNQQVVNRQSRKKKQHDDEFFESDIEFN